MHGGMHSVPAMHSATASTTTWAEYVQHHTPNETQGQVAARTGISQGTISRWLAGSAMPTAQAVVAFARAYHINPVEALVAAGVITADEAVA